MRHNSRGAGSGWQASTTFGSKTTTYRHVALKFTTNIMIWTFLTALQMSLVGKTVGETSKAHGAKPRLVCSTLIRKERRKIVSVSVTQSRHATLDFTNNCCIFKRVFRMNLLPMRQYPVLDGKRFIAYSAIWAKRSDIEEGRKVLGRHGQGEKCLLPRSTKKNSLQKAKLRCWN